MTPEQITLVQNSFAMVAPISDAAAVLAGHQSDLKIHGPASVLSDAGGARLDTW